MKKTLIHSLLLFTTLIAINAPLKGMHRKRKLQENQETDKQNQDKKQKKASTPKQSSNNSKQDPAETLLEMQVEPNLERSASENSALNQPNHPQQASASSTSPSQPAHSSSKTSDIYVEGELENLPEEISYEEMPNPAKKHSKQSNAKRPESKEESSAKDTRKEYDKIIKHYGFASDVSWERSGKRIPSEKKQRLSDRDDRTAMKNMREKIKNLSDQSSSNEMDDDTTFENEFEKKDEERIEISEIPNPNNSNQQEDKRTDKEKFVIETEQEKRQRNQTKKDNHPTAKPKNPTLEFNDLLNTVATDLLARQATQEFDNAALIDAIEGNDPETVSSLLEDNSMKQLLKGQNGQTLIRNAEELTDSFSTSSARKKNEQIIAILKKACEKFQTGTPESFLRMRTTQATAIAQNACNLIEAAGSGEPIQNDNYTQHDVRIALTLIARQLRIIGDNPSNTLERNWYERAKKVIEALQKPVQPAAEPATKESSTTALEQKDNSENISSRAQTNNQNPSPSSSSNQKDDSATPLMIACQNGDLKTVEQLLANHADVHAKNTDSWTALHYAVWQNQDAIIKLLLKAGASINAAAIDGTTPLMLACYVCSPKMVKLLLENGADVHAKNSKGRTALAWTAKENHAAIAELLINARADIEDRAIASAGKTPLIVASKNGALEVARLLLEKGANIHAEDNRRWNALDYAIWQNHGAVTQLLLKAGAILTDKSYTELKNQLRTMLQTHLTNFFVNECRHDNSTSNIEICFMMNDIGNFFSSNLRIKTLNFDSLLSKLMDKIWQKFSYFNNTQEAHDKITADVRKFLETNLLILSRLGLQKLADSTNTVQTSQSSSQTSQQSNNQNSSPSSSSNQNDDSVTPLMIACRAGDLKTAEQLVANGADVHAKDSNGWTALHWAAQENQVAAAELLLNAKASIDDKSDGGTGKTPLMVASKYGALEVASLLLAKGAKVHLQTSTEWHALGYAIWQNHDAVTKLLLIAGAILTDKTKPYTKLKNQLSAMLQTHLTNFFINECRPDNSTSNIGIRLMVDDIGKFFSSDLAINTLTFNSLLSKLMDKIWRRFSHFNDAKEAHDKITAEVRKFLETNLYILSGLGLQKSTDSVNAVQLSQSSDQTNQQSDDQNSLAPSSSNQNDNAVTRLMIACQNGELKTVERLLANGANVHAKSHIGYTALDYAAANDNAGCIKLLLKAGALINATGTDGATPLINACKCKFGNLRAVRCLLKNGANIHAKDSAGRTALAYARENRSYDVVAILTQGTAADVWTTGTRLIKFSIISQPENNMTSSSALAAMSSSTAATIATTTSASTDNSYSSSSITTASTAMSLSTQEPMSFTGTKPFIPEAWSTFIEEVINNVYIGTLRNYNKTADTQVLATLKDQLRGLYPALEQLNSLEAFVDTIMNILKDNLSPLTSNDKDDFRTDAENALRTLLKRDDVITKLQALLLGFKLKAAAEVAWFNNHHDDNNDSGAPGAMSSYERKQWQKVVKIKPDSFTNSHNAHWGLTALMTLGTHALHKHMVPGQKTSAGIQLLSAAAAA